MKDAKGHGSTAHGTGVDQIGQIKTMPLNKLRPHGPTDPALVNKYRELIKSGAPITPILIDTNNLDNVFCPTCDTYYDPRELD
jgi:hypothetical protein